MVYLLIALLVIVGLYAAVAGSIAGVVGAYIACGVAWMIFVTNPKLPLDVQIIGSPVLISLFWPGSLYKRLKKFRHPQRFGVYRSGTSESSGSGIQPTNQELARFSSWGKALAFAKDEAKRSGKEVIIHDHVRLRKVFGTYMHRIYFVRPSGEVREPMKGMR